MRCRRISRRFPPTSLAGAVLPTVAGTPQAQAAADENAIAQTATVPLQERAEIRAEIRRRAAYVADRRHGMSYAVNASVPVIQVAADAYYAVAAGVWFTATQATGPWTIATSVPQAIYTIPPSSPIHYVTYVRIFDVTRRRSARGIHAGLSWHSGLVVRHRGIRHRI